MPQQSELPDRPERLLAESASAGTAETDVPTGPGTLEAGNLGTDMAGALKPELHDALRDLEDTRDEAHEEGFPAPSDAALGCARTILRSMYELSPRRYEIYPTPDGEVAIDAPGGFGRSVLLLCESDGGALCLVNMNGSHRRARYSNAKMLPDGFVREALVELDRRNKPAA